MNGAFSLYIQRALAHARPLLLETLALQNAFLVKALRPTVTDAMQSSKIRSLRFLFGMLSLWAASALGQNTVVSNNNPATFSSAVAMGGTVTFSFSGTITLTNAISVSTNVVVDGRGHQVTISGGSNVQVFIVNSNAALALNNLTLADGNYVVVPNSYQYISSYGGAISNGGTLLVTDCLFTNNTAIGIPPFFSGKVGRGGAIFNVGLLTVSNSTFLQNSAQGDSGEGESVYYAGSEGSGGAVYNAGIALIANCSFLSNSAAGGPGAADVSPIDGGPQGGNGGVAYGGAVCNTSTLAIWNSTFLQNACNGGVGGGGSHYAETGNAGQGGQGAVGYGGAVCSIAGSTIIINSTFASNSAAGGSGGGGGPGIFVGSFIDNPNGANGGNGGNGIGGGISGVGGTVSMTNVTCANDVAFGGLEGVGGSASPYPYGSASGANGIPGIGQGQTIANSGGTFLVKNSILYCASNGTNGFGSILDAGNNINSDQTLLFTNASSFNNVNPLLGSLGNYGGLTQTVPLLPGSPAINAADALAFPPTDQRGYPRPSGSAPDIGAFEYTFPTLSGTSVSHGGIQAVLTSDFGSTAILQVSSNLINWLPLSTNAIAAGPTAIVDTTATNANHRFYRVMVK